ncbi:TPA: hypothetical protein RSW61_001922 [Vibrio harveyi]|nr:hypothetical protein [Vibrio harveyi]
MGGSSPSYEVVGPAWDDVGQDYLDSIVGDLDQWTPSMPNRPSGDGVYGSIGDALGQIEGVQGGYQDFLGSAGTDWMTDRAQSYIDPNYVNMLTDANTQMLQESLYGIDQTGIAEGNIQGSRAGIAQGIASGEASANLNAQLTQYQNQALDRAQSDSHSGMQGFQNQIGAAVDYQQLMRELQQGDASAEWMGDFIGSNPDIVKALLYGYVGNALPQGSVVQS